MLFPCDTLTRHCQSLDGVWRLAFDGKRIGIERKYFLRPPADTEDIAVPSSINELATDRRRYLHMDWVWYFRDFYVPAEWASRRVFLHFGSATYRAEVFLNGRRLGGHEGGFLPFEFELTGSVHMDRPNRLAVRVDNLLSATTVPQGGLDPGLGGVAAWRPETLPDVHYDHFPFMGLHRPVTLYSTDPARLENLRLTTLSIEGKSARLRIEGDFSGKAETLEAWCGKLGLEQRIDLKAPTFDRTVSLTGVVPWSPETPRMYDIHLRLLAGGGLLDHYVLPFGLRTIKVRGRRLLLNGKGVFLRGFGRHEDAGIHGKGLSLPHIVKDHNLLQWVGANSFRTSHYPYSEEVLRLADRQGFMVIAEAAANTLSMRAVKDRTAKKALAAAHTQQIREMIRRDYNHPSVIAWSLGNECETDEASAVGYFEERVATAKALDKTRPSLFVVNSTAESEKAAHCFDLIGCNVYPAWYQRRGRLDEIEPIIAARVEGFWKKYRKPVILTEFGADAISGMHSEYDLVWSEEFQAELIRRVLRAAAEYPFVVGTHVWALADFRVGQDLGRPLLNHKGVFTRERHPKLAAHVLRGLWQGKRSTER